MESLTISNVENYCNIFNKNVDIYILSEEKIKSLQQYQLEIKNQKTTFSGHFTPLLNKYFPFCESLNLSDTSVP